MLWRIRRLHAALGLVLTSGLFLIRHETSQQWPAAALSTVVGSSTVCRPLPSTDDRFSLEICYSTDACNAGSITIVAPLADCAPENAPVTSNDTVEDDFTYGKLGPHTFHLQLYGAARAAQEPAPFLGPDVCAWRFDFDARASGRLGFQVHHVYEDYRGYKNVMGPPPLSHFTPLIVHTPGFPTPFDPVSPTHREHVYLPDFDLCPEPSLFNKHARGFTLPPALARPLLKTWRTPEQNRAHSRLPLCSRDRPVKGAYRAAHPSDSRKSMITFKGYVWEPEPECRMDELPYHDTEPKEVFDLLAQHERSILFLGDSHDRYAYYFMRSWYQQNWTYLLEPYRLKEEHSSWSRGRTRFEFVWDRFMERALPDQTCDDFRRTWGAYDTVVLSAAHHLSITNHGETPEYPKMFTSTNEYVQMVRDTMTTFLRRCLPREGSGVKWKAPRVLWLGTVAYKPPYTRFRWDDHRTNTRLGIWTSRVEEMLHAEFPEVAIVDMFDLTMPMIRETIDGLHFFGTDAAWPIALEVNHKIGLGRPRGWWESESKDDSTQVTYKLADRWPTD
ncbi:hypothetical protein EXIGLDRAFT_764897 [Exidia glandulosa HHB12029]|uniref:Uncharacterized protein n=1 Tax=Exidia glandulosa HHB12029 TaxID=1314781 RepID=A0A165KWF0_EXIGL|nr:hypothetical protein EXIGLDRAFT_764897 [Exidia glandulosa HHB12029]